MLPAFERHMIDFTTNSKNNNKKLAFDMLETAINNMTSGYGSQELHDGEVIARLSLSPTSHVKTSANHVMNPLHELQIHYLVIYIFSGLLSQAFALSKVGG